jgi:hypothetical protein
MTRPDENCGLKDEETLYGVTTNKKKGTGSDGGCFAVGACPLFLPGRQRAPEKGDIQLFPSAYGNRRSFWLLRPMTDGCWGRREK